MEALLCQSVLAGRTKAYQHHPQVQRWREQPEPLAALGSYLAAIQEEATKRGFNYNAGLILQPPSSSPDAQGVASTAAQAALLPPLVPTPPLLEVNAAKGRGAHV